MKDYIWPNLEKSLWNCWSNIILEKRIKRFPINRELLEDFLRFHVEELIPHEGYSLMKKNKLNFLMFMNFKDNEFEQESGIVHEAEHFIYRVHGAGWENHRDEKGLLTEKGKIEETIENEAQRFVKKNKGIVKQILKGYFNF